MNLETNIRGTRRSGKIREFGFKISVATL